MAKGAAGARAAALLQPLLAPLPCRPCLVLPLGSCSSPCPPHTAFLKSFVPSLAFKPEQCGGRQVKVGSEENISSLGQLPTRLPGAPAHHRVLLLRAGHVQAPRRQSCRAWIQCVPGYAGTKGCECRDRARGIAWAGISLPAAPQVS